MNTLDGHHIEFGEHPADGLIVISLARDEKPRLYWRTIKVTDDELRQIRDEATALLRKRSRRKAHKA